MTTSVGLTVNKSFQLHQLKVKPRQLEIRQLVGLLKFHQSCHSVQMMLLLKTVNLTISEQETTPA